MSTAMWRTMERQGGKLLNHTSQADENSLNSLIFSCNSPKQQKTDSQRWDRAEDDVRTRRERSDTCTGGHKVPPHQLVSVVNVEILCRTWLCVERKAGFKPAMQVGASPQQAISPKGGKDPNHFQVASGFWRIPSSLIKQPLQYKYSTAPVHWSIPTTGALSFPSLITPLFRIALSTAVTVLPDVLGYK